MIEDIFFVMIAALMIFAAIAFGIAVGCHASKEDKTDSFFLRRDAFRQKEKALKKQLAEAEARANSLHKDNIALRLELSEVTEEATELRCKIRRLDTAKERRNGE